MINMTGNSYIVNPNHPLYKGNDKKKKKKESGIRKTFAEFYLAFIFGTVCVLIIDFILMVMSK